MKLYVFDNVPCDYTCGMAVAIASNLDEAKRLVMETDQHHPWQLEELSHVSEFDLDTPRAWSVGGGG